MASISKAVIPAAGLGTRMKPISNYVPKPMLPLGKVPVLHHIIDELKVAGITEIGVVARTEHSAIWDYGDNTPGIHLISDNSASGPGTAILKARNFIGDDDFAVIFSDAPMGGADRGRHLQKLCTLKKEQNAAATVSVYQIPESEVASRGVVALEDSLTAGGQPSVLTNFVEKPSKEDYPSRWAVTCRYVVGGDIFDALERVSSDNDELQLTPAIAHLIADNQTVLGLPLPSHLKRYDTGNFEGYFEAFRDFTD